jgi:hypothetical protein
MIDFWMSFYVFFEPAHPGHSMAPETGGVVSPDVVSTCGPNENGNPYPYQIGF